MQLGEVVYGGVGSGLYGMLAFIIIAVFVAGLMIGRTPEYLGKKIEAYEMKMASLIILVMPLIVLTGQTITPLLGKDAFQESDTSGVTAPIVKHSYLVKNTNDLPRVIKELLYCRDWPAWPGRNF
jgi:K+-transporting ATPase A subunit